MAWLRVLNLFLSLQVIHCAEITVQPVSINTTLNSNVNFTCEAIADAVSFLVDTIAANRDEIRTRGFLDDVFGIGGGTLRGVLSAKAYDINNNTNISCRATTFTPLTANTSDTVTLMIQGLLASVGNLNYIYISGSSVLLSWTAPYTLDNVPITGYYINDNSGSLFNTTELSYVLFSPDSDPCVLNNISVAAINGAGIGEPNNVSFYYQRVPSVTPSVSVIPTVNGARQLSLNISIDVTTLCIGEYPNNITVNVLTTNDTLINSTNISPQVNDPLMIITGATSIKLPDTINTFITNVSLGNNGGQFSNGASFVFGFLRPVTNIRSALDNCTNISIYWDSPTLDDDRVSILYYNLSIYDDITGSLVDTVIVNGTSYQFEDTDLFCHRYTYVITGVNELGEGMSNSTRVSYQKVPRSAKNIRVFFGNYVNNNVTISFNIPVELECTGEAPENATVAIECNGTSVYSNTTEVEYAHTPRDITGSVSVPQNELCSLIVVFSNAVGSSEPFEMIFNITPTLSTNTPSPTITLGAPPTSPIFTTPTIVGIVVAGILILIVVVLVSLSIIVLCIRKDKKYPDSPKSPNLRDDEQVVLDGSKVRSTSFDSTKALLACKSSTDEQPTTPTSPTSPTNPAGATGATGATGAAKEPIYSDLGQAPKGGATKLPQSEATVQYADINIVVPKQRATQSYDDVVVGAGTTVIGGGPAVPPPVPAKGGDLKPPPVPKKTKGATTTQMETENNEAARNLPHHVENENFSSPSPPLPPPYNVPVTEGRREGGEEEGGGPNVGATTEIHGTGLVSYL